jgi:hypothetical protein
MVLLTFSIFGPYIVGGLRTDQLVTYACLVILVPLNLRRVWRTGSRALLVTWGGYLLVAVLAAIPSPQPGEPWERGSLPAGIDNLALPLAVMLVVWAIVPRDGAYSALLVVGRVLTIMMAINAFIAALSTQIVMTPLLRIFWANANAVVTVAENAASNGRFSGVFNHPAEAGVLYGVAGLLATVVWRHRPVFLTAVLVVVITGGVLTVSKVFLLGGLPLILLYWLLSLRGGSRTRLVSIAAFGAWSAVAIFALRGWSGIPYLARLISPLPSESLPGPTEGSPAPSVVDSLVDLYSAGRFTEGSELRTVVQELLNSHPVWGVGAGGWQVPYDSGWVESLIVAGVLGAIAYSTALVIIFLNALRSTQANLRVFGVFLAIFLAGASLGIPALTVNRTALGVWLVVVLMGLLVRPFEARTFFPSGRGRGDRATTRPGRGVRASIRRKALLASRREQDEPDKANGGLGL